MLLDVFGQGEVGGPQYPLLWPVLTVPCESGHSSCLFLAACHLTPHVTDSRRGAPALCCPHVADLCLSPRVTSEGMVCGAFHCVCAGGLVQRPLLHLCGNHAGTGPQDLASPQTLVSPPSVQQQRCAVESDSGALERWAAGRGCPGWPCPVCLGSSVLPAEAPGLTPSGDPLGGWLLEWVFLLDP